MADIVATLGLQLDALQMLTELPKVTVALEKLTKARDDSIVAQKRFSDVMTKGAIDVQEHRAAMVDLVETQRLVTIANGVYAAAIKPAVMREYTAAVQAQTIADREEAAALNERTRAQMALGAAMARDVSSAYRQQVALGAAMTREITAALREEVAALRQVEMAEERLARAQGQAMEMDRARQAREVTAALRETAAALRLTVREEERLARAQGQAMEMERARQTHALAAAARDATIALRAQARAQMELGTAMARDVSDGRQRQEALGVGMSRDVDSSRQQQMALGAAMARDYDRATRDAQKSVEDITKAHGLALEMEKRRDASLRRSSIRGTEDYAQATRGARTTVEDINATHGQAIEAEKRRVKSLQDTTTGVETLTTVMARLGLTMTALQAIKLAEEVLMMAARYETLGVVLSVVGRNIGKTRAEMDGYVRSLQDGNISMVASREGLARMAAAGLEVSKATDLAKVAQNAAVVAGTDSAAAFERMITGITTQQPRVLRTLGIYVNFEAAQEKYAKAAGRRVETLTAEEKIQINMTTALAGGAQVAGVYEAAMNTAGKQVTSFVRYVADLKTKLGETFQPAFTAAVFALADGFQSLGRHAMGLSITISVLAGGALVAAASGIAALVAASTLATVAMTAFFATFLPATAIVAALGALGYAWYKFFSGLPEQATAHTKMLDDMDDRVVAYTKSVKAMTLAQMEASAATLRPTVAGLQAGVDEGKKEIARRRAAVDSLPVRAVVGDGAARAVASAAADEAAITAKWKLAAALHRQDQLTAALTENGAKLASVEQMLSIATDKHTEISKSAAAELRRFHMEMGRLAEAHDLVNRKLAEGVLPTVQMKRATEDATRAAKLKGDVERFNMQAQDGTYTRPHVDLMIAEVKATEAGTTAMLKMTRAAEDQTETDKINDAARDKRKKALEDEAKAMQKVAVALLRDAIARAAGEEAIRRQLAAQSALLGIASADEEGAKRKIAYLELLRKKTEEYGALLKVGDVPDPFTARDKAEAFVENQRLIDGLNEKTVAWKNALSSVGVVAKSLRGSFGEIGKDIAAVVSAIRGMIPLVEKAQALASAAREAQKHANELVARGDPNAGTAVKAAGAASSAATAGSLSVVGAMAAFAIVAYGIASKLADSADQAAARQQQWFDAFTQSMDALTAALRDATQSEFQRKQQTIETNVSTQLGKINPDWANFGAAQIPGLIREKETQLRGAGDSAKQVVKLSTELEFLRRVADYATNAMKALAKETADAMAADTQSLAVRRLVAAGRTVEADALRLEVAQQKELADAHQKYDGVQGAYEYIAALQEVQAAETAAAVAARALAETRKLTDLAISTRAFTDPRGAGLAKLDEDAARRYNDAATAAEKAAVALYNIAEKADYLARQLEADTRVMEGLVGRVLKTMGNDRATQNFMTGAAQRQEIVDAIAAGMSPANLALLKFTQFAENSFTKMQRAIEDGTKAIYALRDLQIGAIQKQIDLQTQAHAKDIETLDKQIANTKDLQKVTLQRYNDQITDIKKQTKAQTDAITAQIKGQQAALSMAQKQVSALERVVSVVTKLLDYSKSLLLGPLSPLSPEAKLAEARTQFEAVARAAAGGDKTAAEKLPEAATALLEASRSWNASGQGFTTDFQRVQDAIQQALGATSGGVPVDVQLLAAAQQQVESIQASIDVLNEQKQSIEDSAAAQILILETSRDIADKGFADELLKLGELKDLLNKNFETWLQVQKDTIDRITKAAEDQVSALVRAENAAHQDRLKKNEFWEALLGLTGGDPGAISAPAAATSTKDVVIELKAQVRLLSEGFSTLSKNLGDIEGTLGEQLRVTKRAYNEVPV